MLGWLNYLFQQLPWFGVWMLAVISLVIGSIVFEKWKNIKTALFSGLIFFIVSGAVFLSFGWINGASVIVAIILLALLQIIL